MVRVSPEFLSASSDGYPTCGANTLTTFHHIFNFQLQTPVWHLLYLHSTVHILFLKMTPTLFFSYLHHDRIIWINIQYSWPCFHYTLFLAHTIFLPSLSPSTSFLSLPVIVSTFKVPTLLHLHTTHTAFPSLSLPPNFCLCPAHFPLEPCWPVNLGPDQFRMEILMIYVFDLIKIFLALGLDGLVAQQKPSDVCFVLVLYPQK